MEEVVVVHLLLEEVGVVEHSNLEEVVVVEVLPLLVVEEVEVVLLFQVEGEVEVEHQKKEVVEVEEDLLIQLEVVEVVA